MSANDDHAQKVLLEQLLALRPQLSKDLLLTCYRIEREHQFDREADVVVSQLRRAVERALDDDAGSPDDTGPKPGQRK